jgi:hypothetical protein
LQVTVCAPQELLRIILHAAFNAEAFWIDSAGETIQSGLSQQLLSDVLAAKSLLKCLQAQSHNYLGYQSAIAHKLSRPLQIPVEMLANRICEQVAEYTLTPPDGYVDLRLSPTILDDLYIKANSGYLQFEFADGAIAHWLTSLLRPDLLLPQFSETPPRCSAIPPLDSLFWVQHAHARCCSLLQLACATGLIRQHPLVKPASARQSLTNSDSVPQDSLTHDDRSEPDPYPWQWIEPDSISWLDKDRCLRVSHRSERQLIYQIFTVLDALGWQSTQADKLSPAQVGHLAQELAIAFYTMHQDIQIWGSWGLLDSEHAIEQQNRRVAHLALIGIVQRLLNGLLSDGLGITASFHL